jgi:uncharacterized membrane protein YedE/YeeE
MTEFTPISSALGGALIGIASLLLLFGLGRIAGISGILGGALPFNKSPDDRAWRMAFILGIVLTGVFAFLLAPEFQPGAVTVPLPFVIAGGLIVGFGTRLGSGCTSGHSVCGIGRFSARSIIATCIFMFVAGVTVYVMRHVLNIGLGA